MKLFITGGLILALLASCSMAALEEPKSTIRITMIGETLNPMTISWTIHSHSDSQTSALNHDSDNPWIASYHDIPVESYGEVYITVNNVHSGMGKLTGANAVIAPGGWIGSERILDLESGTADLSTVSLDDYFEDDSERLLPIVDIQNTSAPHQLTIKDNDNQFVPGNWRIVSSNFAYFTVWIQRDGKTLGPPKTHASLIGDVSFSYGSLTW
ncbi:MAG: hypothetical protein RQ801_13885 [Spirochaetaceae bacterium]|nr:hypothetical protein [Spirochaetaceae bacterium]MDT8299391.1 hypothetical protein [Spirochaetaceae bacterium]